MARYYEKRADVPEEYTWDLSAIYENDEAWFKDYEEIKAFPEKLASYAGRLSESADTLLGYFRLSDEVSLKLEQLHGWAHCKSDEDLSNSKYLDMESKAFGIWVAVSGASSFAAPEIMALSEEKLSAFFAEKPELEEYRRSVYSIRRRAAHVLSPECEKLLAMAGEVAEGPDTIGGIFRNADLSFPDVTDSEGKKHALTDGSFVMLLENPDSEFRKAVFDTYYDRLGEYQNTCAAFLDAQFKQLKFFSTARNYGTTLEASLDVNEVPVSVYYNLIDTVHANLDKMHRYYSLRKKILGLEELRMSDVYVPIVPDVAVDITFEEAKKTVIEALAVLGDDYTALLKKGFEERWIDVYENAGKRGGAYSSGISRPHPYVLLNHKDNLDGQFTLAHEMGHALHSYYSSKTQPVSTSDYVIFVAEVASTCNEVLLMKHLLSKTADKKQRAYLINHFLDQFKGTVYRQTMFAEFELEMGKMCENGEAITAEALCKKYRELNELYYGPDMVSDDRIALEWARIPHFFYNYYVFQYATGFSAAVAIANRILREGESAVADYKKFLSSGSSADPISLLKIAGVDMSKPEPISDALRLFGELIDELEGLCG